MAESVRGFSIVKCELSGGPTRYMILGLTRGLKMRFPLSLSLKIQALETKALSAVRLGSMLGGLAVLLEK